MEYARELRIEARSIFDSAVEAARLRFRPILMTSLASILGVAPLVFAEGAAAGQQALGAAVFGGMIASTILAVFLQICQHLSECWRPVRKAPIDHVQHHCAEPAAQATELAAA